MELEFISEYVYSVYSSPWDQVLAIEYASPASHETPATIIRTIYKHRNASSNHPPSLLKQIPKFVSKRIATDSCKEDIFRKSAPFYNSILQGYGFNGTLNTAQKNWCRQEEGETVTKTSYGTILHSAKL